MDWRDILLLYRRELRSAFRERSIVVNAILLPVFLYPVLLWVMFSAMTLVEGLAEGFTSRVAVAEVPAEHRAIVDSLAARDDVILEERAPAGATDSPAGDTASAEERLAAEELDAILELLPATGEAGRLAGNVRARIVYDRSEERSRRARDRIQAVLDDYREQWMEAEAGRLAIAPEERLQFRIVRENVTSESRMGAVILSQLIPLFLIIMVALGCFIPSIDTTAGERERSTWETTMTLSASRLSVVTAKYLYVATLGILAGLLNVVAILLSIGTVLQPLLREAGGAFTFSIPLAAVPIMAVGAVAMALFFGAAMMIMAAFARTFKDGQAMVTPVYWLALLPILLGNQADRTLTPVMAAVPVANVATMIRDAINGVFLWPLIAETLVVTAALVAVCLVAARAVLRFEDFLLGSYDGSFWRFMKERLT